nr:hypothetical protein [Mycolicibacterium duvalii]
MTDAARQRLIGPSEFTMNRAGMTAAAASVLAAVPASGRVKIAVEAAGH